MLRYVSTGKVALSALRRIQEEIASIDRSWWRGAIGVEADEPGRPSTLSGATALFITRKDLPESDDLFMAFSDAVFIAEILAGWAKRFGIKWHLTMNGDDWGAIDATGPSPSFLGQMNKWARRAGVPATGKGVWAISEERRAELGRRHGGGIPP